MSIPHEVLESHFWTIRRKKSGPQPLHYSVTVSWISSSKENLNTCTGANAGRFSRLLRFNDLLTTALFVSYFLSPIHNLQILANGRWYVQIKKKVSADVRMTSQGCQLNVKSRSLEVRHHVGYKCRMNNTLSFGIRMYKGCTHKKNGSPCMQTLISIECFPINDNGFQAHRQPHMLYDHLNHTHTW